MHLKDCKFTPNALFTLEQCRVPVLFASVEVEVALHAFMNNKHAAQRVVMGKCKHKEKPSHTAWKRTMPLNLGMVKHRPRMYSTHGQLNGRWQNAGGNTGASGNKRGTKFASVVAFGRTATLLNWSNAYLAGGRKQRRGGSTSDGYFMCCNMQWEAFPDTYGN